VIKSCFRNVNTSSSRRRQKNSCKRSHARISQKWFLRLRTNRLPKLAVVHKMWV